MSTRLKEEDNKQAFVDPKTKVKNFLKDLRNLLDSHRVKIYTCDCEVYIDGLGFIGTLEDNVETLEIVDGDEILYSTERK
tara:strand:+ start:452 stop:691 length:240 start_codon:yes stop_codon:yes gene_type:complete